MLSSNPSNLNMPPSIEQQDTIDAILRDGHHVVADACPGAGKSEMAFSLLEQSGEDMAVLLTYNRALADSNSIRLKKLRKGQHHIASFTYHSLLASITGTSVKDDLSFDRSMRDLTASTTTTSWAHAGFTLLILDEAQDLRPSFFGLVKFLLERIATRRSAVRLLVIGDRRQLLYDFFNHDNADVRFLSMMDQLAQFTNHRSWQRKTLTCSYRLTPPLCSFLNALLQDDTHRIRSSKEQTSVPVSMFVLDVYVDAVHVVMEAIHGYQPSEIFVLCSSLKDRSASVNIVNHLMKTGITTQIQRSGTEVQRGLSSLSVRTCHAAKGLESPLVIFVNTNTLDSLIKNSTYVALSRASHKLVVLQHHKSLSMSEMHRLCDVLTDDDLSIVVIRPPCMKPTKAVNVRRSYPKSVEIHEFFAFMPSAHLVALTPSTYNSVNQVAALTSTDTYLRDMTVHSEMGHGIDMTREVGGAIYMAAVYFLTGQLPTSINASLAYYATSDDFQHEAGSIDKTLQSNLKHITNDEGKSTLDTVYNCMPAFISLFVSLNAIHSFRDKSRIRNFDFILVPSVLERLKRTVDNLRALLMTPDIGRDTSLIHHVSQMIDGVHVDLDLTVVAPLMVPTMFVVHLVHGAQTHREDILVAMLLISVSCCPFAYIVNTYDGTLETIHVSMFDPLTFIRDCVFLKLKSGETMSDDAFIRRYQVSAPEQEQ